MAVAIILIIFIIFHLIDYFLNHNKHLTDSLISIGTVIITNGFIDLNQLFIILLAIFNKEQIEFKEYLNFDLNYLSIIFGLAIILLGVYLKKSKEIELFNIQSFEDKRPLIQDINSIRENKIDIITLYNDLNFNKGKNTKILVNDFKRKIDNYKLMNCKSRNAYAGIASIPLVLYAGTMMKEIDFKYYYEYNKKDNKYSKLKSKAKYDKLKLDEEIIIDDSEKEIVLAIGITTKIKNSDLSQFNNMTKLIYNIDRKENNMDNYIKSVKQLKEYVANIYDIIRKIYNEYPKIKTINLIVSSQSCILIELGKMIEDRNICEIISYQFSINNNIKYPWGIKINGKDSGTYVRIDES